jgi:hypothetical protein
MSETKINSHAARFFLRQPIRIDAGKRLNQRTLAVIYVAGGGENGVPLHHFSYTNKGLNSAAAAARDVTVIAIYFHFEMKDCLMAFMSGFS